MNRFFIDSLKMMRENYIRAFGGKYDTEMCPIKDVEVDERDAAGIVTASTGFLRGADDRRRQQSEENLHK